MPLYTVYHQMVAWLENNELERIWKEALWPNWVIEWLERLMNTMNISVYLWAKIRTLDLQNLKPECYSHNCDIFVLLICQRNWPAQWEMFIKVFRVVNWCHFSWTVIFSVLFVDFLLVTVATNETDGFKRFIRSARVYNIPVKVRYTWYPGLLLPLRRWGSMQLEVLEMFGSTFGMLSCGHLNTYKVED